MPEQLEGTVPLGAMAAVTALCYAATAPVAGRGDHGHDDGGDAMPMPPPLVPMLVYLLGSCVSFAADSLVPHLRCPRPYDGPSTLTPSRPGVWPPAAAVAWLVDAVSRGVVADDDSDSRVAMQRLIAAMPCPTTMLGLPRDHRGGAGLRKEAILGFASSVRTGLSTDRTPGLRRLVASEATFTNSSALKAVFLPPPVARPLEDLAPAAVAVAPVLFCPSTIETLTVRRPVVAAGSSSATEVLSEVFEKFSSQGFTLPRLTEVDLSYNDELRDETVCRLVAHPCVQSRLRTLRLWLTPITRIAVAAICDKCTGLRILDLANCSELGDDDLRAIGSAAFAAPLIELRLSYTGITDAGLCDAAPRLRALSSLTLRGCKIGDAGIAALVRSPCAPKLELLDLSNLEPVGAAAAGSRGGISDVTLVAVADACPRLTWLSVMNSKGLTSAAVRHFMESRAALSSPMRALNLRSTGTDDAALEPLLSNATCVSRLASLELWQCAGVSDQTLSRLAQQLLVVGVGAGVAGGLLEDIDVSYTGLHDTGVTAQGFADFVVAVACAQAGCTEAQAAQEPDEAPAAYSRRTAGYCGCVRLRNLLCLGAAGDGTASAIQRAPFLAHSQVEIVM